jgi:signal peptidase I
MNFEDEEIKREEEQMNKDQVDGARKVGSFAWDLVKVVAIAMIVVYIVHRFFAQPFIVSGSSMEPNFHTGEYLVIDELSYRLHQPVRGDIIVFKYPKDTSQYFIKRVIGLPGEKVLIENGRVKVFNTEHPEGFYLDEKYLPSGTITSGSVQGMAPVQLGNDEYYVLGDNRVASSDSRFWGTVPKYDIVGKAFIRAFPLNKLDTFPGVTY